MQAVPWQRSIDSLRAFRRYGVIGARRGITLSTVITSQLLISEWRAYMGEPTLADAILDRLIHAAHQIALKGEAMRKNLTVKPEQAS